MLCVRGRMRATWGLIASHRLLRLLVFVLVLSHEVSCKGGRGGSGGHSRSGGHGGSRGHSGSRSGGGGSRGSGEDEGVIPLWVCLLIFACVIPLIWLCCCLQKQHKLLQKQHKVVWQGVDKVADLASKRLSSQRAAYGSPPQLPSGRYLGKYEECRKEEKVTYELSFLEHGQVIGSGQDADGPFNVRGYRKDGLCCWAETCLDAYYTDIDSVDGYTNAILESKPFHVEVNLRISESNPLMLEGHYWASTQRRGKMAIKFDGNVSSSSSSSSSSDNENDQTAPLLV